MFRKPKKEVSIPSIEQGETERKRYRRKKAYRKALRGTVYVLTIVAAIAVLISTLVLLVGCKAQHAKASFMDISWTRQAEHDQETIRFAQDGSFYYSCACGNPVNDADLCQGYTYDAATNTITLDYLETTPDTVTVIKVVSCDENQLQLDFDGEIRTFTP